MEALLGWKMLARPARAAYADYGIIESHSEWTHDEKKERKKYRAREDKVLFRTWKSGCPRTPKHSNTRAHLYMQTSFKLTRKSRLDPQAWTVNIRVAFIKRWQKFNLMYSNYEQLAGAIEKGLVVPELLEGKSPQLHQMVSAASWTNHMTRSFTSRQNRRKIGW